jgi:hypothetical protein
MTFTNAIKKAEKVTGAKPVVKGQHIYFEYKGFVGTNNFNHIQTLNLLKMTTYNIKKSYEGAPSKTKIESKGLTLEKAISELDLNESLWLKNGGSIIERTDTALVCEESDASNVITWEIIEVEEWD